MKNKICFLKSVDLNLKINDFYLINLNIKNIKTLFDRKSTILKFKFFFSFFFKNLSHFFKKIAIYFKCYD